MKREYKDLTEEKLKEAIEETMNLEKFKDTFPERVGDRLIFRTKEGYANIPFKDFDEAMKKEINKYKDEK